MLYEIFCCLGQDEWTLEADMEFVVLGTDPCPSMSSMSLMTSPSLTTLRFDIDFQPSGRDSSGSQPVGRFGSGSIIGPCLGIQPSGRVSVGSQKVGRFGSGSTIRSCLGIQSSGRASSGSQPMGRFGSGSIIGSSLGIRPWGRVSLGSQPMGMFESGSFWGSCLGIQSEDSKITNKNIVHKNNHRLGDKQNKLVNIEEEQFEPIDIGNWGSHEEWLFSVWQVIHLLGPPKETNKDSYWR